MIEKDFNPRFIQGGKSMSTISNVENAYVADSVQTQAVTKPKTKVKGRTIGEPELSEKAAKYYEQLKKKYSNMDFILVSKDQKEQAQAQAGRYANGSSIVVLIDEEKIERMAEDEKYREQYESIIRNAASGLSQMKASLSTSSVKVKAYGIKVNDDGVASLFAVIDKSLEAQKERIEKNAEERKAEQRKNDKNSTKEITVTASSIDELLDKIYEAAYGKTIYDVKTEEEKLLGQNFDFRM